MTDTVVFKPIVGTSAQVSADIRWKTEELALAWKKFSGKEEKPVDQSPNRGSSWMGR